MYIEITMDNKDYNSFTEIGRISEEEEYQLGITVYDNDGNAYDLSTKTIVTKLKFVNTTNDADVFEIAGATASLAAGTFTVDLKNALTDKGGQAYFVYWYLDNQTDGRQYNILSGRLIIDKVYNA